ncbi:hypothetical protein WA158_003707 [Blastocystis sp. Blastoise]
MSHPMHQSNLDLDILFRYTYSLNQICQNCIHSWNNQINHILCSYEFLNQVINSVSSYKDEAHNENMQSNKNLSLSLSNNKYDSPKPDQSPNEHINIYFKGLSTICQLSRSQINQMKGTYISEMVDNEELTDDGSVYVEYEDTLSPLMMDIYKGTSIDYSQFTKSQQIEILRFYEFLSLPMSDELSLSLELFVPRPVKYSKNQIIHIKVNGILDDILTNFMNDEKLMEKWLSIKHNSTVLYDYFSDMYYIDENIEYIQYIDEYITSRTISIPENEKLSFKYEYLIQQSYLLGHRHIAQIRYIMLPFFSSSSLLDTNMQTILSRMLGINKKWTRIYSGKLNGFGSSTFHSKCDNQGETVVILNIKRNQTEFICGGYTSQSWNSDGKWIYDKDAFLFSLPNAQYTSTYIYPIRDPNYSIYGNKDIGPQFGAGPDLCIANQVDNTIFNSSTPYSYDYSSLPHGQQPFIDATYFQINEIEVFKSISL